MPVRRFVSLLLGLLFVVQHSACQMHKKTPGPAQPLAVSSWIHPQPSSLPRRVVIVAFENQTVYPGVEQNMELQLAAGFRQAGLFEVVDAGSQMRTPCRWQHITRGDYPVRLLADSFNRFSADAVLFGAVTNYQPYAPMSLGITLHLVDTRQGLTLASFDGQWTVADPMQRRAFEHYLSQREIGPAWADVYEQSPTAFGEFVVDQLIARFGQRH